MITIENLTKYYGTNRAVNGISFTINDNEILGFLGPNGAGKSTLLKGILGLQKISSGKVTFDGIDKSEIGYLPQKTQVQKDFPAGVKEVVLSGRLGGKSKLFYTAEDRRIARENMDMMKINSIKNKSFNELSGGQQQRVSIARALAGKPPVILADEPTGALDSKTGHEILEFIQKLHEEGTTIVLITHDNSIAAQCPRVIRISDGKIIEDTRRGGAA